MALVATTLLMSTVGFHMDVSAHSSLTFDAQAAKNRPVSKVITLLKDMLKQLEKEADEDEEIYDKIACWCETNDKEKTKSIKDAEKEVAEDQESLDQATELRRKQLAEFNAEE